MMERDSPGYPGPKGRGYTPAGERPVNGPGEKGDILLFRSPDADAGLLELFQQFARVNAGEGDVFADDLRRCLPQPSRPHR